MTGFVCRLLYAYLRLTFQVCMEMGWRGRNGMFDVLPLVLQANGGDPELFELPSHLIMEVLITHPTCVLVKITGYIALLMYT